MPSTEETITGTLQLFDEHRDAGLTIVEAFKLQGIVRQWVSLQSSKVVAEIMKVKVATPQNVVILGGLWKMCAGYGVCPTDQEKVSLFQHYLNS